MVNGGWLGLESDVSKGEQEIVWKVEMNFFLVKLRVIKSFFFKGAG